MTPIAVFLNPHARKNRDAPEDHLEYLRKVLGCQGRVWATRNIEELRVAVSEAFDEDARYYVADGGDGSFNFVLHELRTALADWGCDADDVPPITPTRSGTIDFLARKVGIRGSTDTILRGLRALIEQGREPQIVKLESMRLSGRRLDANGNSVSFERLGFALAAGGVGQRFFAKYYQEEPGPKAIVKVVAKAVGSHLTHRLHVPLPAWMRGYGDQMFRPTHARVTIDGRVLPEHEHGAIHAGAFEVSLGGVFRVFPLARDPGVLHFQAGSITPREIIRSLPRLIRGETVQSERLIEQAGREMVVEALGNELIHPIVDGEEIRNVKLLRVAHGPAIPVPVVD